MKKTEKNVRKKAKAKKKTARRGISPVVAVILLGALALGLYALVHHFIDAEEETPAVSDDGTVEVFNGDGSINITPQDGVPVNDLEKDDFEVDGDGTVSYIGTEYTASRGIDVSSYQGDIDWQQVSDSGIDFAIIRIGGMYYGSGELYSDENFVKNIEGAKAAGLRVGAYFFSQAITSDEAKSEAQFVLGLLESRELDLPVFFDWERISTDTARTDGLDNETLTDCAVTFCETVSQAGYDAGVYIYNDTGYYGYDLARLQDYTLWCVGIGSYPCFYYAHSLWQYSISGTVPGINATCDLDMMFERK